MGRYFLYITLIFSSVTTFSQPTEIPEHIYFAGMKLNLSKSLRTELQNQVAQLTKNKTYFQAKVDRADAYFPIIERVFDEEGIPHDFKYLVIQESQLQSDAVSTSNAVGFWQFKKESAQEVGLTIDHHIDERRHIVESTRGAARYLKKNYLLLTNWVYALTAYNTGYGGVKNYVETKYVGAMEMDLDMNTHWYPIKFLAHKIAYEDKVGYNHQPELSILEYNKETKGKTISEIASITKIDEQKLKDYNKWLLKQHIPEDKDYTVLLPVTYLERDQVAAALGIEVNRKPDYSATQEPVSKPKVISNSKNGTTPIDNGPIPLFVTNNGLNAIIARESDNAARLAFAGRISVEKFFQYNDMQRFEDVKKGQTYYLESKNNKGIILYHTVKAGETAWEISQKYGIKLSQLVKKNRMEESEALLEGRLLYLRFKRPEKEPIMYAEKPVPLPMATIAGTSISKTLPKDTAKAFINTKLQAQNIIDSTTKKTIEQPKIVVTKDTIANIPAVPVVISAEKKDSIKTIAFPKAELLTDSSLSYHSVNQGQTLYALSRYYAIKIDTLKLWNGIGAEGIKFGQRIVTSKNKNSIKNNFTFYKVKNSQNLFDIASEIGIKVENIVIWNGKKDNNVIPGELLKIKNGK